MDKVAWFLERKRNGSHQWWGATGPDQPWTIDPHQAVHFTDKESAERAALVLDGDWFPTDHLFVSGGAGEAGDEKT